jgi:hypothetical protein
MLDLRFRPLEKWKETKPLRWVNGQFRMPWNKTLDALEEELKKLKARDIIVEAGFKLAEIRNDGWPRGGAEPSHPGVILYFTKGKDTLRFACGTYQSWRQNIHAIYLTLESLRAVDRYGATAGQEQYTGFKQLPPSSKEIWSAETAAIWLCARTPWCATSDALLRNYDDFRRAYRECASALHPDKGGSADLFQALGEVSRVLEEHFKQRGENPSAARKAGV